MKLVLQIMCWFFLAFGIIAFIGLMIDANNGTPNEASGIAVSLAWIVQSVLTLGYLHTVKETHE